MRNKLVVGLLLICSALCLSSCGNTNRESQREERAEVERDKYDISGHKEKDTDKNKESEVVTDKNTNQGKDIDHEWYKGRFYRDISNAKHWLDFRDTEKGLTVDVPGYSFIVSQPEVIESKEYGTALRYQYKEEYGRFDFILDYMIERDEVVVLYTNYTVQSANAVDYSGVYVYDDQLSSSMENTQTSNDTVAVSLVDGQNFECFETVGGEDIMLTVHLYYSDDSDTPSAYKGEMNNGVEFWFELYDTHTDEVSYKINCLDNSNAFLIYYPSRGEIELTAEEGTGYGNMYPYCGTYICLPDEFEE